uniref:FBA_2 domain-containing protein n=1 Tax=Panagrellus redivivus TaxID=6233 RepID=A0A7E4VHZ0_PANRE
MPFVSRTSTESVKVPFKLFNLEFSLLRNFLDIMPSADLYILRKHDATIDKMSCFRGEIVTNLYVISDTVQPWNRLYESYSKVMSRPVNLTPFDMLEVCMGPDICPEALLSKMNEKTYRCLQICGQYHWKQVITFLHTGINDRVCLYDTLDLPEEDMEDFFKTLYNFKINKFYFCNKNCTETWLDAAYKTWSSLIGTALKSVEVTFDIFFTITAVANNDTLTTLSMKFSDWEDKKKFVHKKNMLLKDYAKRKL